MATEIMSPSSRGHTRATAGREGGRDSMLSVGVKKKKRRVDGFIIFVCVCVCRNFSFSVSSLMKSIVFV